MRMRWKIVITRAALLATFVLSGCMFSATIDVTGHWTGTLQYTTGPATGFTYPIVLDLVNDNRDLTGTITLVSHSTYTFELSINSGQARSSGLHIDAFGTNPHVDPSPTVSITLDGQVDATTMSGNGAQVVDGVTYEFTWEATFVPSEGEDQ